MRITDNAHGAHCLLPVTGNTAVYYRYWAAALGIIVTVQNPPMRTTCTTEKDQFNNAPGNPSAAWAFQLLKKQQRYRSKKETQVQWKERSRCCIRGTVQGRPSAKCTKDTERTSTSHKEVELGKKSSRKQQEDIHMPGTPPCQALANTYLQVRWFVCRRRDTLKREGGGEREREREVAALENQLHNQCKKALQIKERLTRLRQQYEDTLRSKLVSSWMLTVPSTAQGQLIS